MPLRGIQLSMIAEVAPYPLENPPRQDDRMVTGCGRATVTHVERTGRAQPPVPESLLSPPEHTGQQRRHSPKGRASGWLEQRLGNKQRKTPSVSYYYRWEDCAGRHSLYVPIGKRWRVQQMVEQEQRSIEDVLQFLTASSRKGNE